ncbi:hypothetical protein PV325_011879 [Microctonus aethiopoides]|uniref:BEN domain-containing protein n=1 Tax=Microctonus aethiopoides TaxID=144406 RepID=A0AA39F688_9HYME|nr:hypothetical protein PV325_011879 [Microctonus aethiopoides]KAK0163724.1 hypothetical protein PV328_002427 [Microctonus aethiopoides]
MAYYLVYWLDERTKSVVPKGQIYPLDNEQSEKTFKPDINDIVNVRWDHSKYKAKILRISTTRKYLENIFVTENGDIVPSSKSGTHKFTTLAAAKEKKTLVEEKKKSNTAQKKTEQINNTKLLSDRSIKDLYHHTNNEKLLDGQSQMESHYSKQTQTASTQTLIEPNNDEKCSVCASLPPITAEMISNFELVLNHLKARHEHNEEKSKMCSKSLIHEKSGNEEICLPQWRKPGPGKIELVPNSGVWLKQSDVDFALYSTNAENPNEVARKLLKIALGEANIHKYCALGTSSKGKLGIPPILKTAVFGFVQMKIPGKKIKNFNRVINLMCSSRSVTAFKKQNSQSAATVSSQLNHNEERLQSENAVTVSSQLNHSEERLQSENAATSPKPDYMYYPHEELLKDQTPASQDFSFEQAKYSISPAQPNTLVSPEPASHYWYQQASDHAPSYQIL